MPGRAILALVVAAPLFLVGTPGATAASPPSAAALNACLGRADQDACLDQIFRSFLAGHSTTDALALLGRHQEADWRLRLGCHPVAHAIGRETFRVKGTIHDAFAACDQTCHSGCYHGVVERFLLAGTTGTNGPTTPGHVSQEDLRRKAREACDPRVSDRVRFQCLHGLGHAVMYFTGYQLERALGISCGSLP